MFSKLAVLVSATMAVVVVAGSIENSCNAGPVQCCNQVVSSESKDYDIAKNAWAALAHVDVGSITAPIGLQCTPVSVLAVAGNSCSSQPVCCSDNQFNGVVALGCSPINVNV